jgi:hypothetical protein
MVLITAGLAAARCATEKVFVNADMTIEYLSFLIISLHFIDYPAHGTCSNIENVQYFASLYFSSAFDVYICATSNHITLDSLRDHGQGSHDLPIKS